MKVLILSHMFPIFPKPALGKFVLDQARELRKKCDVIVIAPVPWVPKINIFNQFFKYSEIPEKEEIDGLLVYHPRYFTLPGHPKFFLDGFFYFWSIKELLKKIKKDWNFDIIHTHSAYPDSFAVSLFGKRDFKLITTIHSGDLYGVNERSFCAPFIRRGLKESNLIIVVSNKVKEVILKFEPVTNITVIHNGINLGTQEVSLPTEIRNIIKDKIVIVTVGSLNMKKGHAYVIKALKILIKKYPRIIYLIVGDGPEKENLTKLVKQLDLEDYVYFSGALPHATAMSVIKNSDIFILPSWDEGFGIVYLEAMLYGKCVIGSKGEGADDIITDGQDGLLIQKRDASAIVRSFTRLIENPEERRKIGDLGEKKVIRFFLTGHQIKKTLDLYHKLLCSNE